MTLLLEHWKPVVGFERYEISCTGSVRDTKTGRLLKPYISQRYLAVTLRESKGGRCKRIHCLVADTFLGPLPPGMERNHKDGKKINNRASNLEFLTKRENFEHALRLGLLKQKGTTDTPRILSENQVIEIRARYQRGMAVSLGLEYGVSKNCINDVIRRKTWSHL